MNVYFLFSITANHISCHTSESYPCISYFNVTSWNKPFSNLYKIKETRNNWSWTDLWFQFSRFTITARGKGAKFHNSASTTILKWRLGCSMATRNNWSWTASCFKFSPFHNHKIGQAARVETARDQISRFCVDNYFKMAAWLSFRGNNK